MMGLLILSMPLGSSAQVGTEVATEDILGIVTNLVNQPGDTRPQINAATSEFSTRKETRDQKLLKEDPAIQSFQEQIERAQDKRAELHKEIAQLRSQIEVIAASNALARRTEVIAGLSKSDPEIAKCDAEMTQLQSQVVRAMSNQTAIKQAIESLATNTPEYQALSQDKNGLLVRKLTLQGRLQPGQTLSDIKGCR